jgi:hypothetical protein
MRAACGEAWLGPPAHFQPSDAFSSILAPESGLVRPLSRLSTALLLEAAHVQINHSRDLLMLKTVSETSHAAAPYEYLDCRYRSMMGWYGLVVQ